MQPAGLQGVEANPEENRRVKMLCRSFTLLVEPSMQERSRQRLSVYQMHVTNLTMSFPRPDAGIACMSAKGGNIFRSCCALASDNSCRK